MPGLCGRATSLRTGASLVAALLGASCAMPHSSGRMPNEATPAEPSESELDAAQGEASDEDSSDPVPSESKDEAADGAEDDTVFGVPLPIDPTYPVPTAEAAVASGAPQEAELASPLIDPDGLPVLVSERVGTALGSSGALSIWLAKCARQGAPGCTGGFVSGELGVFGAASELGFGFTLPSGFRYLGVSVVGMTIAPSVLHQWQNWSNTLNAPRTMFGATLGLTYIVNVRGGAYEDDGRMVFTGSIGVGN